MISDTMMFFPLCRSFGAAGSFSAPSPELSHDVETVSEEQESTLLRTLGWVSAGLGAMVLGLVVGRELRQRYKFNRRTPYDLYSHSGDEREADFGLGI